MVRNVLLAGELCAAGLEDDDAGRQELDVRVRAGADFRSRPEDIAQITVPSATGTSVRLSDVAQIVPMTGPASIQHLGRQRQATIFISTTPGASEQTIIDGLASIQADMNMVLSLNALGLLMLGLMPQRIMDICAYAILRSLQ